MEILGIISPQEIIVILLVVAVFLIIPIIALVDILKEELCYASVGREYSVVCR